MREIFSAFGSEVFRPLMTILLPGLVAISTLAIGLIQRFPMLRWLVDTKRIEAGVIVFVVGLAVGEILEDVGSHIEGHFDDRATKKNASFKTEWYDYLALSFPLEPVGHRYLRTLVLRLKFEFGLSLGLCGCAFGLPTTKLPWQWWLPLSVALLLVAGYLMWEAKETHTTLGILRRELLARLRQFTSGMAKKAGA